MSTVRRQWRVMTSIVAKAPILPIWNQSRQPFPWHDEAEHAATLSLPSRFLPSPLRISWFPSLTPLQAPSHLDEAPSRKLLCRILTLNISSVTTKTDVPHPTFDLNLTLFFFNEQVTRLPSSRVLHASVTLRWYLEKPSFQRTTYKINVLFPISVLIFNSSFIEPF